MSKILLTGKNGQVGWELQRTLAPLGQLVTVDRQEMDLVDPDSIRRVIRQIRPSLIVNAAGYTAVDKAEHEPGPAMAINGVAPGIMAEEAKQINAALIHYSTDYVFDGSKKSPYNEEDKPNPLSVYGRTKLAGEQAIQAVGAAHIILRTSWVYGIRGRNFLLTILGLAREKSELRIVNDQKGSPTWSRMLAEVTSQMLVKYYSSSHGRADFIAEIGGLYHVTSSGVTTWYDFARKIIEAHPGLATHAAPKIMPISTADYPSPARRPLNSALSNAKLRRVHSLVIPPWEGSLALCLEEVIKAPVI